MSTTKTSLIGLGLAALLFLVLNLFAGPALRGVRADLTEQQLYTLSDGTRNILGNLEEPVTLRLFFSETVAKDYPAIAQYAERVQEMLEEYVAAADGKVKLEVIDPEPFSKAEELAVGYGIQGSPVPTGDMLYFGLVGTNSVDDEELMPGLDPRRESYLEYELTEMIDKLERPELPVVGLISSLPLRGGSMPAAQPGQPPQQTEPWPILEFIQQRYELRDLAPESITEIPDDIAMLLMIHPKGMTPEGLYAVDQFCLKGGKVVAFVDSYCVSDPARQSQDPMAQLNAGIDSGIDPLLNAWGVKLTQSKIVGDETNGLAVGGRGGAPVTIPVVFDVPAEALDGEDILTSSLQQLRFFMPGELREIDEVPEGVNVSVLASTSAGGGLVDSMTLLAGIDPQAIADAFVADTPSIPLGMRINGTVNSAFPDGPPGSDAPDAAEGEEPAPTNPDHLAKASAPFNAVVFSDADMLDIQAWGQATRDLFGRVRYIPNTDNPNLLVSALENLAGSNDLISLRSRAEYQRPFTRKQELEKAAQEKFREREQELEGKLQEIETKFNELQAAKDPSSSMLLSPEQQEQIEEFRQQRVDTRSDLREVKSDLRAEIEALGTRLKLFNIFLIPAIIAALVAMVYLAKRGKKPAPSAGGQSS